MRLFYPKKNSEEVDAFIFSPVNSEAYNWLDMWPKKAEDIFCTYLFGPPKSGKKHLAKLWCENNNGVFSEINSKQMISLKNQSVVCEIKHSLDEEELFHFYNVAKENKNHILFISDKPLNQLSIKLPDLRSRLQTAHQVEIQQPDEELVCHLYKKKFDELGIAISQDVLSFLSIRLERRYDVIDETVKKLEGKSFELQHTLTIPFVKKILDL